MAQLLIHSFSSHISSQGMGCAIAATVSAGMAGRGTLVKSGWVQSTEGGEDTGVKRQEAWLPGATRSTTDGHDQAGKPREEGEDKTKHGCYSAY